MSSARSVSSERDRGDGRRGVTARPAGAVHPVRTMADSIKTGSQPSRVNLIRRSCHDERMDLEESWTRAAELLKASHDVWGSPELSRGVPRRTRARGVRPGGDDRRRCRRLGRDAFRSRRRPRSRPRCSRAGQVAHLMLTAEGFGFDVASSSIGRTPQCTRRRTVPVHGATRSRCRSRDPVTATDRRAVRPAARALGQVDTSPSSHRRCRSPRHPSSCTSRKWR